MTKLHKLIFNLISLLIVVILHTPGTLIAAQLTDSNYYLDVPHDAEITALAASADLILSGDALGILKVWRAIDGSPVKEYLIADGEKVSAVAFDPENPAIAAVAAGEETIGLNLITGDILWRMQGGRFFLAYSTDGRFLATSDGGVRITDMTTREHYVTLADRGSGAAFIDEKTIVYTDGAGLRFLDILTGRTVRHIPDVDDELGSPMQLGYSPERRLVFDLRRSGYSVYNVDTGALFARRFTDVADDHLAFSDDGDMAISARWNGAFLGNAINFLTVYDGDRFDDIYKVQGATATITKLMIHEGVLFIGQRDGRIRRWTTRGEHDNTRLEYLPDLGQFAGSVTSIATSDDGRFIALGGSDGVIDIFDAQSNSRRTIDPNGVRPVPPAPNFGSTGVMGMVTTFTVGIVTHPAVTSLRFEPESYLLRAATEGKDVALVDALGQEFCNCPGNG